MIGKYIKKRILRWATKELIKEQQKLSAKYDLDKMSSHVLNEWHHYSMKQDDLFHKLFPKTPTSRLVDNCRDPLTLREYIFFSQVEVEVWCEDSLKGRFYIYFDDGEYIYFIEDDADAVLFKLTWM